MRTDADPTRVALVLGSGGARGYAHIGVVQALVEAGVEIVAVSGCSMGALVGGMHAAGKLDDYVEFATGLGRFEVLRMMDVALSGPGAIRGEKIFAVVGELLGDVLIEDLPIDYTAVAVDLVSRREVWFQAGPLADAIRASSAIPSFFVPVLLNGRVLVDGAVLDPVPVAPVTAARADVVIAVTLDGQGPAPSAPVVDSAREAPASEWSERLRSLWNRWFDSELVATVRRRLRTEGPTPPRPREEDEDDALTTLNVVQASYEIMQAAITRHRLAGYAPDRTISVPKAACRVLDYHRAAEMIALGRSLAEEHLADMIAGGSVAARPGARDG